MTLNPREQHHFDRAQYFQAVRGAKPSTRIREQFQTLADAETFAAEFGDGRTMIYAVSNEGSAHIKNA